MLLVELTVEKNGQVVPNSTLREARAQVHYNKERGKKLRGSTNSKVIKTGNKKIRLNEGDRTSHISRMKIYANHIVHRLG